jgi:uncharacterized membrane protein
MKALVLTLMAMVLLVLLVVPYGAVLGANQLEYSIQVLNDGSATWTVTQTLGINSSIETLETLQNRITLLANASENVTGRAMVASADSVTFTASGSYVEAVYKFQWENFSKIEGEQIIIGDVFQVSNFFSQYLYGDGAVYMSYPAEYVVVGPVQPEPSTQNDSIQLLSWLGTADFNGSTRIVLEEKSANAGLSGSLEEDVVLIMILAAIAAGSVGFYMSRNNRKKKMRAPERAELRSLPGMESDEEKAVKLIKSSGGSLRQSAITDQLGFSKAKTSQLLAVLEHKGVIRRYKRGRDKIVVLVKESKGEIS